MSVTKGNGHLDKPRAVMLELGLAGQTIYLLEKQQQRKRYKKEKKGKKKKKKKAEARGLGFSSGVFISPIFLPTDPQMSMAATAAVSPSDYLQPAAATTQASTQWALRGQSLGGLLKWAFCLTQSRLLSLQTPREMCLFSFLN